MVKKYAISNEVPKENEYLTSGKKYEIVRDMPDDGLFTIRGDNDDPDDDGCLCSYNGCAHLGWKEWTIIEEEE